MTTVLLLRTTVAFTAAVTSALTVACGVAAGLSRLLYPAASCDEPVRQALDMVADDADWALWEAEQR